MKKKGHYLSGLFRLPNPHWPISSILYSIRLKKFEMLWRADSLLEEGNWGKQECKQFNNTLVQNHKDIWWGNLSTSFPSGRQHNLKILVPVRLHEKFENILHHKIFVLVPFIIGLTRFINTIETHLQGVEESPTLNVGWGGRPNSKEKLSIDFVSVSWGGDGIGPAASCSWQTRSQN